MVMDCFQTEFAVVWGRKQKFMLAAVVTMGLAGITSGALVAMTVFGTYAPSDGQMVASFALMVTALACLIGATFVAANLSNWGPEQTKAIQQQVADAEFNGKAEEIARIVTGLCRSGALPQVGDSDSMLPLVKFPEPEVRKAPGRVSHLALMCWHALRCQGKKARLEFEQWRVCWSKRLVGPGHVVVVQGRDLKERFMTEAGIPWLE